MSINIDYSQDGNSLFENVYITGLLDYDFSSDNLKVNSLEINNNVTVTKDLIVGGDSSLSGNLNILKDLNVEGQSYFTGIATFAEKVDFNESLSFIDLEIRDKLDIGVGGTVFTASSLLDPGKVGIGSTQPTEILDILGVTSTSKLYVKDTSIFDGKPTFNDNIVLPNLTEDRIVFVGSGSTLTDSPNLAFYEENQTLSIAGSVGIGTTIPYGVFQINDETESVVVAAGGTMAIGSTTPYGSWTDYSGDGSFNDSIQGKLRLSIDGSIRIGRNIYDSGGSAGINGMFLQRDENGIHWTAYEPSLQEGILIQDEGNFVPINVGTAQTFSIVNFSQVNSFGTGVDTLIPTLGNASTGLATIFTNDFWGVVEGHVGLDTGIYRMTNVGIGTTLPVASLQVGSASSAFVVSEVGRVGIGTTNPLVGLDVHYDTHLRSTLKVDNTSTFVGLSTFNNGLIVHSGVSTFHKDVEFVGANAGITSAYWDQSDSSLKFLDNVKAKFGDHEDLKIYHTTASGGYSVISEAGTGQLVIGGNIIEFKNEALNQSYATIDSTGIDVTGNTETDTLHVSGISSFFDDTRFYGSAGVTSAFWDKSDDRLKFNDEAKLVFGSGNDLRIYHTVELKGEVDNNGDPITDNTRCSLIKETGSGGLIFKSDGGGGPGAFQFFDTDWKPLLKMHSGANARTLLYHNGLERLETTVDGIDITGHTETDTLRVSGLSTFVGIATFSDEVGIAKTLSLQSNIVDVNNSIGFSSEVGVCKTDYRLASVGTGVSWRPSGVQTKNAIWVSMNGCDSNSGLLEGDAKKTIGGAAAIAEAGDTIIVRSGVYYENNPVGLRTEVTISGEDLRLVTVVPNNVNKDVFQVRAGCLIQNLNFAGQTSSTDHSNCGAVAFPPTSAGIAGGVDYQAVTGYTALGPANQGPDRIDPTKGARYRSPYVRNCTNFMTGSVGMKINGDYVNAAFTGTNDLGQDLKSMVCDSFTQYNQAGVGVSLTNNAYAQLVSIFTIGCDIAIFAGSGGQCDLTNSNSSFGNFGLKADGIGDVEFTGSTDTASIAGQDTIAIKNVTDIAGNFRKPFDGQGAYFKINLDDYPDALGSGTITEPLQLIRSIDIVDGGSGYNPGAPPNVTIPEPQGPEAILPEFSANVGTDGSITSIDVIASGRNFVADQDFTVTFSTGNAVAKVNTDPILYTVSEASEPNTITGLTNVTFNEFIPYSLDPGVDVEFSRLSRIITSSHSFEYVGAGTDLNRANPFQGGEPIPENEIVAINGGQVPFTSTDQKGNFRIGEGLTIDQTTSTIRGRDFNRAIQAQLTPLILALR